MFSNLHLSLRAALRNRAYSCWFVFLLTLGIGINASMFSILRGVLLKPLPYPGADRLVRIRAVRDKGDRLSTADFQAIQQIPSFANTALYREDDADIQTPAGPVSAAVAYSEGDLFDALGVRLLRGHTFSTSATRDVIVSYRFWQDELGGDSSVLGKSIDVDRKPYRIIGVAPEDFAFPSSQTMLWLPLEEHMGGGADKLAIARLKTTASPSQAQAEINVIAARLMSQGMDRGSLKGLLAAPLENPLAAGARLPLLLLTVSAGLVLLLSCANLSHLQMSQSARRMREVAVRQALGAPRTWAVWQVVNESMLLFVAGGACSLGLSLFLNRAMRHFAGHSVDFLRDIHLDWTVFLYSGLLCLMSALVSGIVPVFQLYRMDVNQALRRPRTASPLSRNSIHPGRIFAASEVACSVALLVIFGVMAKSLWNITRIDPGFDAHRVLSMWITLPDSVYRDDSQINNFFSTAIDRIKGLPGVETVGVSSNGMFLGSMSATVKDALSPGAPASDVEIRSVSDGIFPALQVKLLHGRFMDTSPQAAHGSIGVVLDELLARKLFPNDDPIGKRVQIDGWANLKAPMEVVGVVSSMRDIAIGTPPAPTIYVPYWASPSPSMSLLVRTKADPYLTVASIRKRIESIDAYQPVAGVETLEAKIASQITPQTIRTLFIGIFGLLAIIVAVSGVYSVVANETAQRTLEIAISMALGATVCRIVWLYLKQGIQLIVLGALAGVSVGMLVNKIFASLWFEVDPLDILSVAVAVMVTGLSTLFATYYPALRATRISPAAVLRHE